MRKRTLFIGTLNQSIAYLGDIFREAIRDNVAQIIIAHNHPTKTSMRFSSVLPFTPFRVLLCCISLSIDK
ncbi:hypothetical protein KJZ24_08365 [Enterococcus faecalis]|uniref:JAB domain-containing protein n=1 Tax=Enterococcus TaxID=1350 RepID=UPI0009AD2232|nr:hypothetical protein DTO64_00600 [Enterococcus faecalis]AYZ08523.1 hypothetical protein EGX75_04445 [Enterococcus faecalis]EGO6516218.1 hypothetical protein [Enterococcus faecalis]EGO8090563.1 hypothetical protein [Enterococcus faecalis]EGO9049368.1 hypothetical protein [Enterococcus faecalis]